MTGRIFSICFIAFNAFHLKKKKNNNNSKPDRIKAKLSFINMTTASESSHTMQIEITQVSELELVDSSNVYVYGIPWYISISKGVKGENGEPSLHVYLVRNTDDFLEQTVSGAISCKLLPLNGEANVLEKYLGPFALRTPDSNLGDAIIGWNDLFDGNNKYVKDDAIKLEIKIETENPNDPKKSDVKFDSFEKSCDCGCLAIFRVVITNVSNLWAVRTPRFNLRGKPWSITIGKERSSNLFANLCLDAANDDISCEVKWSIKLLSSKDNVDAIEQTKRGTIHLAYLEIDNIVSGDELFKPENGFVNDDSITLDVKIKTGKLQGVDTNDTENEAKTPQMECPICLKCIANQHLSVTPCGHIFCSECIKTAITNRAACPTCNAAVQLVSLRRLYLPA